MRAGLFVNYCENSANVVLMEPVKNGAELADVPRETRVGDAFASISPLTVRQPPSAKSFIAKTDTRRCIGGIVPRSQLGGVAGEGAVRISGEQLSGSVTRSSLSALLNLSASDHLPSAVWRR